MPTVLAGPDRPCPRPSLIRLLLLRAASPNRTTDHAQGRVSPRAPLACLLSNHTRLQLRHTEPAAARVLQKVVEIVVAVRLSVAGSLTSKPPFADVARHPLGRTRLEPDVGRNVADDPPPYTSSRLRVAPALAKVVVGPVPRPVQIQINMAAPRLPGLSPRRTLNGLCRPDT